ncbi:unnamed protein product, partial [Didymodactylos carnosus]
NNLKQLLRSSKKNDLLSAQTFLKDFHNASVLQQQLNLTISTLCDSSLSAKTTSTQLSEMKNFIERNMTEFIDIKKNGEEKFFDILKTLNNQDEFDINHHSNETTITGKDQSQKQIRNSLNMIERDVELELLNERTSAFIQLENDLINLKETFIDLKDIVHSQGYIIDNIERSIVNVDDTVKEARINVEQAIVYKKSSKRKKWALLFIIILAFIILCILFALVLKFTFPFG